MRTAVPRHSSSFSFAAPTFNSVSPNYSNRRLQRYKSRDEKKSHTTEAVKTENTESIKSPHRRDFEEKQSRFRKPNEGIKAAKSKKRIDAHVTNTSLTSNDSLCLWGVNLKDYLLYEDNGLQLGRVNFVPISFSLVSLLISVLLHL